MLGSTISVSCLFRQCHGKSGVSLLPFVSSIFSVRDDDSCLGTFGLTKVPCCSPCTHLEVSVPLSLSEIEGKRPGCLVERLFDGGCPSVPIPGGVPVPHPISRCFGGCTNPASSSFGRGVSVARFAKGRG